MFPFSRYVCTRCGFELPPGWGAFLYVIDAQGERVPCPHPAEDEIIRQVIGKTRQQAEAEGRLGYQTQCVCLGCSGVFPLDLDRDPLRCPDCPKAEVRTAAELIGGTCPRCRSGVIQDRARELAEPALPQQPDDAADPQQGHRASAQIRATLDIVAPSREALLPPIHIVTPARGVFRLGSGTPRSIAAPPSVPPMTT